MYDVDKAYTMIKEVNIKLNKFKDIKDSLVWYFGKNRESEIVSFIQQAEDPATRREAYQNYPDLAKQYRKVAFSIEKPTKGQAARNNKVIDMNLAVLTHETTAHRMLNPGGFEAQKRMGYLVAAVKQGFGTYEELSKLKTGKLKELCMTKKNLCFIDINTQFYAQNNAAGTILGMFAVQKTAHAILENNKLHLDVSEVLKLTPNEPFVFCGKTFYDLVEFDATKNYKGEYIGKILGSLVASAADAVKDPVLNLMFINNTTANVLTTMIRFGIPFEQAALLTSQKIIGECLSEFNTKNLDGYIPFTSILEEKILLLQEDINAEYGDQVSSEEVTEKELIQGLTSSDKKIQYKALLSFYKFTKLADELRGPTFATRFNSISNAVGPLIIDNLIMENKLEKFSFNIKKKDDINNVYDVDIQDIFDAHPILESFSKALDVSRKLFGDNMPLYTRDFQSVVKSLPKGISDKIFGDRKLLTKLSDFYLSYLLVNSGCIDPTSKKGLNYYINDFPKEFFNNKIKEKHADNLFVQAITIDTTNTPSGEERFILKLETTGMDTIDKNRLTAGWEDLVEKDFNLSMKLFKYCFYRGGIGFTPKTFMSLLPNSIKTKIPKYIESFKNQIVLNPEYVVDQFVRNNWQNNKLAPRIQDAEDFIDFNENKTHGIVDFNYLSVFNGIEFCRIRLNKKDKLFKVFRGKDRFGNSAISLVETTPLGNNGEYLEISLNDIEKSMDDTTLEVEDFDNTIVSPAVTENSITNNTVIHNQKYVDLIAKSMAQDKIKEFKLMSSDTQKSYKPGMKTFFTNKFKKLGIEFNMEEFDKLFETLCS